MGTKRSTLTIEQRTKELEEYIRNQIGSKSLQKAVVNQVVNQSLGRIIRDSEPDFSLVDEILIREVKKAGGILSGDLHVDDFHRDYEKFFCVSSSHLGELENISCVYAPQHLFQPYDTVKKLERTGVIKILGWGNYHLHGQRKQIHYYKIRHSWRTYYPLQPQEIYLYIKFKESPIVVKITPGVDKPIGQAWALGSKANEFIDLLYIQCSEVAKKYLKNKIVDEDLNKIRLQKTYFKDLVYPSELEERINFLVKSIDTWLEPHSKIPTFGAMLYSPPGYGKTSTLLAIAHKYVGKCTIMYIDAASQYNSVEMGNTLYFASLLRPTILVIDEAEKLGKDRRNWDDDDKHFNNSSAVQTLMQHLDSGYDYPGVFLLMATMSPDRIHPAIKRRPGRSFNPIRMCGYERCLPELIYKHSRKLGISVPSIDILNLQYLREVNAEVKGKFIDLSPDILRNTIQSLYIEGIRKIKDIYEVIGKLTQRVEDFGDKELKKDFLSEIEKD
jgi:AAA+ superfamily predicted ATPase